MNSIINDPFNILNNDIIYDDDIVNKTINDILYGTQTINKNEFMNYLYNYVNTNKFTNIEDSIFNSILNELIDNYLNHIIIPNDLNKINKIINNFITKINSINNLFKYCNFKSNNYSFIEYIAFYKLFNKLIQSNIPTIINNIFVNTINDKYIDIINFINLMKSIKFNKSNELLDILENNVVNTIVNTFNYNIINNDFDNTIELINSKLNNCAKLLQITENIFYWQLSCKLRIEIFKLLNNDFCNIFDKFNDKSHFIINNYINTIKSIYIYTLNPKYNKYRQPVNDKLIDYLNNYMIKLFDNLDIKFNDDKLFNNICDYIDIFHIISKTFDYNKQIQQCKSDAFNKFFNNKQIIYYINSIINIQITNQIINNKLDNQMDDNLDNQMDNIKKIMYCIKFLDNDNLNYFCSNYYNCLIDRTINNHNYSVERKYIDQIHHYIGSDYIYSFYNIIDSWLNNMMMNNNLLDVNIIIDTLKYKKIGYDNSMISYHIYPTNQFDNLNQNDIIYPDELQIYIDVITKYYNKIFDDRKLNVNNELSIITIKINNKFIKCNINQYLILKYIDENIDNPNYNDFINNNITDINIMVNMGVINKDNNKYTINNDITDDISLI